MYGWMDVHMYTHIYIHMYIYIHAYTQAKVRGVDGKDKQVVFGCQCYKC